MNLLRTEPNPTLVPLIKATKDAREAAYKAKIARAKTNFDVLLAQGVICTPDDEMERSYRWEMISDIALALGVKHREVEAGLDLIGAETAEIMRLRSIVQDGESRAEYLARVGAVMATLPKGKRRDANWEPTDRNCTHRGKAGWKFRGYGDGVRLWCTECGMEFNLPARGAEPSPDAQAAQRTLAEAAAWYTAQGETALAAYTRAKNDVAHDSDAECWWRERNAIVDRGRAIRKAQEAEREAARTAARTAL